MQSTPQSCQPIKWQDEMLHLLDQRALPQQEIWLQYASAEQVAQAIQQMVVRGAPAIGITAAYAVVLAARAAWQSAAENWKSAMQADLKTLAVARPTAVNLEWAIQKMQRIAEPLPDQQSGEVALLNAALQIHQHDIADNHQMGHLGAALLSKNSTVLTHCNAGALATGGFGTALGVIRQGFADGNIEQVYVDETRPWLQGARLTAWELTQDNIPCILQPDVAAASVMANGKIDWVIVGADRIAANGDVANKIGTYGLAILAKYHQIKVMVVTPTSTIDWQTKSGELIPIEQRAAEEVTHFAGKQIAPDNVNVANPAFDVTPAALITAIVTESGVVLSPSATTMKALHSK